MATTERDARVREIRRIFEEYDFGDVALLEGWDGNDLEQLAQHLTPAEYETLLDELRASEGE